jgi:hypothetical protein
MTTIPVKRSLASLKLPRPVPALIALAKSIVQSMSNNPAFSTPDPTLATVSAAIADLEAAETAAKTRIQGAVAVRNEKRAALVTLLGQLKSYIQKTADANPETATSVIQSAGIKTRKPLVRAQRVFAATPGTVSGQAKLVAQTASRRAAYEWEYSTDGGKTWVAAPATLQAKATVFGLTPGANVQFRYRAVLKTGEGDWSQPTSLIVR